MQPDSRPSSAATGDHWARLIARLRSVDYGIYESLCREAADAIEAAHALLHGAGVDHEALVIERDDAREALRMIRDAWNAHFDTCPTPPPDLPAPSWEDLERWRDAPSGTASA